MIVPRLQNTAIIAQKGIAVKNVMYSFCENQERISTTLVEMRS